MIRRLVLEAFARNPPLAWASAVNLLLAAVFVPAMLLDPAQILGVSRWLKPLKFAISLSIYLVTMIWLLSYVPNTRDRRAVSHVIAWVMTGEIVLITMQAARGVTSHFNHDTAFDDAVFSAMGALILINSAAVLYTAYLFFTRVHALGPALLTGIRLALLIFVAAGFEGGLMVANDAHTVGSADGGPGLPLVNWSTGAGDLRVAHFLGMHVLQALPLLGWWLDRSAVRHRQRWIALVASLWVIVTGLLIMQAMAGQPLIRFADVAR